MKRNDGAVSDEMVDLYRGLLAVNTAAAAQRPITPGAGVDQKRVIRPSKRVKDWHRSLGGGMSLKARARDLARHDSATIALVARRWLASKGARP